MKTLAFVLLSLAIAVTAAPSYFTRFGPSVGDTQLYRNDDGYSESIPFTFFFRYFGEVRHSLYVANNGLLSFDFPVWYYTPTGLSQVDWPTIAPYWGDVDTRPDNGGEVYYRETSDPIDLEPASEFIRQTKNANFVGVKMFVVTWNEVGYYGYHVDKRCTFQAILIADDQDYSAVIFNYGDLQWTTGDASGGFGGFGGYPAVSGFADGRMLNYAELPGSLTGDVLLLNQGSNVNINGVPQTGRYVFYVSYGVSIIDDPCCDANPPTPLTGVPADANIFFPSSVPAAPVVSRTDVCATGTPNAVQLDTQVYGDSTGCPYTVTRTWTQVDSCLRIARAVQNIQVNCRDNNDVPSCDSAVTGVADATVTIDDIVIDFVGMNGAPGQYRVDLTIHFNTLVNDWRLAVAFPNPADGVVHWGSYYNVYNGGGFACGSPSDGAFTITAAGAWTLNVPTVQIEYFSTNTDNLTPEQIVANTRFTVYTTNNS